MGKKSKKQKKQSKRTKKILFSSGNAERFKDGTITLRGVVADYLRNHPNCESNESEVRAQSLYKKLCEITNIKEKDESRGTFKFISTPVEESDINNEWVNVWDENKKEVQARYEEKFSASVPPSPLITPLKKPENKEAEFLHDAAYGQAPKSHVAYINEAIHLLKHTRIGESFLSAQYNGIVSLLTQAKNAYTSEIDMVTQFHKSFLKCVYRAADMSSCKVEVLSVSHFHASVRLLASDPHDLFDFGQQFRIQQELLFKQGEEEYNGRAENVGR